LTLIAVAAGARSRHRGTPVDLLTCFVMLRGHADRATLQIPRCPMNLFAGCRD
jgi:hypothetical protein